MDKYYDNMEKVWETKYPSTETLKEVNQLYQDMEYKESPQEIIDKIISSVPIKINRVLEFGCDNGIMLNYFRKYCNQLYGVDINQKSIEKGKVLFPDLNLLLNENIEIPFDDKFFDIIFASAVLKHIRPEDRPLLYKEFRRTGKYLIVFEKNSSETKEVKDEGFTFYNTNFKEELAQSFKPIIERIIGQDLIGLYELK